MWETIKTNVIAPGATRLGTLVAGTLAPFGVNADLAHQATIGLVALGLIAVDLVAANLRRKRLEDAAVRKAGL